MRVILRQEGTGLYLQPAGSWSTSRATAREFINALSAYWWAIEQRLLGSEVVLSFGEAQQEFVPIRVRQGDKRTVIDCEDSEWSQALHSSLFHGFEVELLHFDYDRDGESCELLAQVFSVDFALELNPEQSAALFRKKRGYRANAKSIEAQRGPPRAKIL